MKDEIKHAVVEEARVLLDGALDHCRRLVLKGNPGAVRNKACEGGHPDPVTDLDRSVEQYLIRTIRDRFTGAPVVAEETASNTDLLSEEICFLIDPIDGTRELVAGGDGYCISVALLAHREPVLGGLDFPARGQRFWAKRGGGATRNDRRIRVSRTSDDSTLSVAVSPAQAAEPRFEPFRAGLRGVELRSTGGLSAKLVGVATGIFDAAFFLDWTGYRTFPWDYAASGLILEEAGGRLTDLHGVRLLSLMPGVHTGGWLASNGWLHERMLTSLRECR